MPDGPLPPPSPMAYRLFAHAPGDEVTVAWLPAAAAFAARITVTWGAGEHRVVRNLPIGGSQLFDSPQDLLRVLEPFADIPDGFDTQLRRDQAQPRPSVRPAGGRGGQTAAAPPHRDHDLDALPVIAVQPRPFPSGPVPPPPPLPVTAEAELTPALLRAYSTHAGPDVFDAGRRAWLIGFASTGTDHDHSAIATFARAALDRPDLIGARISDNGHARPRLDAADMHRLLDLAVTTAGRLPDTPRRPIEAKLADLTEPGKAAAWAARALRGPADRVVRRVLQAVQPSQIDVPHRAFADNSHDGDIRGLADRVAAAMYARGVNAANRHRQTDHDPYGLADQLQMQLAAVVDSAPAANAGTAAAFPRRPDPRLASLAMPIPDRPPPRATASLRR